MTLAFTCFISVQFGSPNENCQPEPIIGSVTVRVSDLETSQNAGPDSGNPPVFLGFKTFFRPFVLFATQIRKMLPKKSLRFELFFPRFISSSKQKPCLRSLCINIYDIFVQNGAQRLQIEVLYPA